MRSPHCAAIAYHYFQLDWEFRATAGDIGLPDLGEARRLLVEKMAMAMTTA
jgi:hypothetical protein